MKLPGEASEKRPPVAGWLRSEAGQLFCWYHPPLTKQRDLAVLLCDPLGSDRMNLHLTYRHLAMELARSGIPVLRLDYPGTCDSEGSPRDPDRIDAAFRALHRGADFLKETAGCDAIGLFGARMGGTIALRFAAERDDVVLAGVWGAFGSGRDYIRNQVAFERMMGANPHERKPARWQEGDVEAAGFLYTGRTVEDLRKLTLADLPAHTCPRVLTFDWDTGETSEALCRQLAERLPHVKRVATADSGTASLQRQEVPTVLIRHFAAWAVAHSGQRTTERNALPSSDLREEITVQTEQGAVRERAIRFGHGEDLFGILSCPGSSVAGDGRPAIVIVNGGNNHRVGINRNHVEWSRAWASRGWTVLRFDIRGLGDSPPRKPADLNRLYLNRSVSDLREACDWLQITHGFQGFVVAGLCAGAYQALHLARSDARVQGLMLLELRRIYSWEPLRIAGNAILYRLNRRWARMHPMWLVDRGRIGKWLREICARGTRCLVVYRKDEGMLERFKSEIAANRDDLERSGNLTIRELGPSNHILSPLWAQEELAAVLDEFLEETGGFR